MVRIAVAPRFSDNGCDQFLVLADGGDATWVAVEPDGEIRACAIQPSERAELRRALAGCWRRSSYWLE